MHRPRTRMNRKTNKLGSAGVQSTFSRAVLNEIDALNGVTHCPTKVGTLNAR